MSLGMVNEKNEGWRQIHSISYLNFVSSGVVRTKVSFSSTWIFFIFEVKLVASGKKKIVLE